jgi:hypothetical protein
MANENTLADLRQTFPAAKELEDDELLALWQRHNNAIAADEESDFGRLLDDELASEDDFESEEGLDEDEDEEESSGPETPTGDLLNNTPSEKDGEEKKESGSEPDKTA